MLPKIAFQTFFVKLPLSGKELECRSYLVKEDRILLMAAQSEDVKQVAAATRQVMNACVLEPNFDVINLSNIDADFLLLSLRSKSVGEKSDRVLPSESVSSLQLPCARNLMLSLNFLIYLKLHLTYAITH